MAEDKICRRQLLLSHFGEDFDAKNCNFMCDNCLAQKNSKIELINCKKFIPSIMKVFYAFEDIKFKPTLNILFVYLTRNHVSKIKHSRNKFDFKQLPVVDKIFLELTKLDIWKLILELLIQKVIVQNFINCEANLLVVLSLNKVMLRKNNYFDDIPIYISRNRINYFNEYLEGSVRKEKLVCSDSLGIEEGSIDLRDKYKSVKNNILSSYNFYQKYHLCPKNVD